MQAEIRAHVRHNMIVNVTDGAFFGFGLGFASFVTIIPLFVSTLTDSAVLIGLVASLHLAFWQLPQVLTANRVARLSRYKPMVLFMTLHERFPFFGLAITALLIPVIGNTFALILTFLFVSWQALGGGLTATAWQSMIAKVMPLDLRGTFYGMQSAAANLLQSGAAVMAGGLLEVIEAPQNFALCFAICGVGMLLSMGFLAWTREPVVPVTPSFSPGWKPFARGLVAILGRDKNFRWFIVARSLVQIAAMVLSFYTVYATRQYGMSEQTAGIMTGVLLLSQVVANPLLGMWGDRSSHRLMMALGVLAVTVSAVLALIAPDLSWFYIIFALAGFANAAVWTTAMVLNAEFGSDADRPYYLGLGNSLVAPATLLAPVLGGWLADTFGFGTTFIVAAVSGVAAIIVLLFILREPRGQYSITPAPIHAATGTD